MTVDQIISQLSAGYTVDLKTGLCNYRLEVYRKSFDPSPTEDKFARINQNGHIGAMLSRSEFIKRINGILPYCIF